MKEITITIIASIILAIVLTYVIVSSVNYFDKKWCLDSDNYRRWHGGICEEYHNGEWIEIDSLDGTIIYNRGG